MGDRPSFRRLGAVSAGLLMGATLALAPQAGPAGDVATAASAPDGATRGYLLRLEERISPHIPFRLEGRVPTDVRRPVRLERLVDRAWVGIESARTDEQGNFRFRDVRLDRNSVLRAVAPERTAEDGTLLPEVTTRARSFRLRRQVGELLALPPIAQRGRAATSPAEGHVLTADFTPGVDRRRVFLERRSGGTWVRVAKGRQDPGGQVVFTTPTRGKYRAVAKPMARGRIPEVSTPVIKPVSRELLFEDTFSGTAVSPTWTDFNSGDPNAGRSCTRADARARYVSGGVLHMGTRPNPDRAGQSCEYLHPHETTPRYSPYLLHTQLSSLRKFRFKYGFAAARIDFQEREGQHAAFWAQTGFPQAGNPAAGVELDVVEYFGKRFDDKFATFVYYRDDANNGQRLGDWVKQEGLKPRGDRWDSSYHVFSVEWTPEEYVFRVDGKEYMRFDQAISHTEQWLVLSSIAATWELPMWTTANVGDDTRVDWVRVWNLG